MAWHGQGLSAACQWPNDLDMHLEAGSNTKLQRGLAAGTVGLPCMLLQVYSRLSERLGVADHPALLSVILNKLAKNLTVYARHEPIVHATLSLFSVRPHPLLPLDQRLRCLFTSESP
jgi:hypothetical protein